MIQNRRKFGRINAQQAPCVVRLNSTETEATLIDESIGGLRVGGISLFHLFHDQEIWISYDDDTISGRCRAVKRDDNDLYEIGILRDLDPVENAPVSLLINTFVDLQGHLIVCLPKRIVSDNKVEISLLGGKDTTVSNSLVRSLTREERSNQLLDADACLMVGRAYNAIYNKSSFDSRQAILLHEYGPVPKAD